jgi:hypothetical protein
MLGLQSLGYVAEGEGFVLRRNLGTLRSLDLSGKKGQYNYNFWTKKTKTFQPISNLSKFLFNFLSFWISVKNICLFCIL